jgi:predicted MFS family arabinose efflux permease
MASVLVVLIIVMIEPTQAVNTESRLLERFSFGTIRDILGEPSIAFTTLLSAIGMYAFQSLVSFLPTFLEEFHSFEGPATSLGFGLFFASLVIGLPVFGRLGDRTDADYGVVLPMIIATLALAFVVLVPTGMWVFLGLAVLGFSVTWSGSLQARLLNDLSEDARATGFGLSRTAFVLLGSVGNAVTGTVADTVGWTAAFASVDAVLLVGICLLIGNRVRNWGL